MAVPIFVKSPYAILDYTVDWTSELDRLNDEISSSEWVLPCSMTDSNSNTSLTLDGSIVPNYGSGPTPTYSRGGTTFSATTATIWIAGGAVGSSYTVMNAIVTVAGRQYSREFSLQIAQQ